MKTVRVKIYVAVAANGEWNSYGWSKDKKDESRELALEGLEEPLPINMYIVEAEVTVPETPVVRGNVRLG